MAAIGTIAQKRVLHENIYIKMICLLKIVLYYDPTFLQYNLTGVSSTGI